jgi:uncharacterized protein
MKIKPSFLIICLGFLFLSSYGKSQENEVKIPMPEFEELDIKSKSFPNPIGYVNDFEGIFTDSQRNELSKTLENYNFETTRQLVVVIIDSIHPYDSIQEYATDLGNAWGIGTAETHNGLVVVVCMSCSQIGIATGLGTQLILTDEICKDIIEKTIIPDFKTGAYYKGVQNGITELIKKWK